MKFLQLNHFKSNFSLPFVRYLSQMTAKNTAAVCQFTATSNKEANLKIVTRLVSEAAEKAKVIFLPEACDYVGTSITETKQLAEPLDGKLMSQYKLLAQRHNVWLSIGGFHERQQVNGRDTLHNTHVLINSEGVITGTYRKVHLFDVSLPESNINLQESSYITAGTQIGAPVSTPIGSVGLMICYDLRFPELSLILRKNGGDVLTFPSAFTVTTGEAHWKTLLKSRAIENQCYVIAAAQYGVHNRKRISFGNSLIVDPWGNIIAECPAYSKERATDESIAYANINVEFLKGVRQKMPVLDHRRDDLYRLSLNINKYESDVPNFMFSDKVIPPSTVFYISKYCFAFTNIRCVVPGRILNHCGVGTHNFHSVGSLSVLRCLGCILEASKAP
uniref:CN hydrolase domain-containing protein n=1 Tax=Photinus pyralis TaxID=7054 RepID=A0A1Y1MK59_PHOPY